MADNNQNQDPNQDPFSHPIRRNNWWLYIFGGLVIAGIIIWFFVDWSYKNRVREPEPVEQTLETPVTQEAQQETLPGITVEENECCVQNDSCCQKNEACCNQVSETQPAQAATAQ